MTTYEKLLKNGLHLDPKDVERICKKYRIKELSIFGSAIRDDFSEKSDVDLLVSFINNMEVGLFEVIDVINEFELLLKRKIDLVPKEGLKYPVRRQNILTTREIVYVA